LAYKTNAFSFSHLPEKGDYVPAVLTRLLAAFDCKPDEMVLKINVSCP